MSRTCRVGAWAEICKHRLGEFMTLCEAVIRLLLSLIKLFTLYGVTIAIPDIQNEVDTFILNFERNVNYMY